MNKNKILKELIVEIYNISKMNNYPIVIQSNLFPLIEKKVLTTSSDVKKLMLEILNIFSKRTLLMPTFINYLSKKELENGIINLDNLKCSTGVLNEEFRKFKFSSRTISPTQPWSVTGKYKNHLINLKPKIEWGENSILEWMQKNNVQIIMIGENKVNNVLKHRVEFMNKKIINYRKMIKFNRKIIVNKKKYTINQNYFGIKKNVKEPNYEILWKKSFLKNCRTKIINGLEVNTYCALEYIDEFEKKLKKDLKKINKITLQNY